MQESNNLGKAADTNTGEQGTASTNVDKENMVEVRDSENEDFEVTPDSQIFEVLSSEGNS
jgi:hypothetical protein